MTRMEELRRKKDLSQLQVQMKTGINQSDYSKIERGARIPSVVIYRQLAVLFDTSVDYLIGLTDIPKPYPRAKDKA